MALAALLRLELLNQRRQPFVLFGLLGMGLVGTPLATQQALSRGDDLDLAPDVLTDNLHSDPRIEADAIFAGWVSEDDGIELASGPLDTDGEPDDGEVVARVRVDETARVVHVETGPRGPRSGEAIDRIRAVRTRHDRDVRAAEAERLGVDLDALQPEVVIVAHERAGTRVSAWVLYGLPWLMTMLATTGVLYGAFDVLLSERLHHTAETLLTSAATRRSIALAKGLIVGLLGFAFAGSALVGLGLAQIAGLFPTLDPAPGLVVGLGAATVAAVLSVQLSVGFLSIATYCEDHKTAGLVAGPMLLAPPILAGIAAFPGPPITVWSACLPVTGVLLLWRDALLGTLTVPAGLGVGVAVVVQTGLAWRFAARRLSDPDIVTGQATAEGRRGLGRFGPDALMVYALTLATFWFIGVILQQLHLETGLVLSQLAFVGIGLGAAWFYGMDPARLRLALPRPADLGVGVGTGLCTPALALAVMVAQEAVFPGGAAFAEKFGAGMELEGGLVASLLLIAVLPGLCEEILFRSALLGMMERDARPVPRVLVVALLFGLLHLSIFRLIPTTLLGIVFGWLTLRTRSVWPGVLAHMTHNAVLVSVGTLYPEAEVSGWAPVAVAAATVGFAGLATVVERRA